MTPFTSEVNDVVRRIPEGDTMTYKEVAMAIDKPDSARAVANVMAKNFDENIPCHRVIRSDGKIGGYNRGGEKVKEQLLVKENAL